MELARTLRVIALHLLVLRLRHTRLLPETPPRALTQKADEREEKQAEDSRCNRVRVELTGAGVPQPTTDPNATPSRDSRARNVRFGSSSLDIVDTWAPILTVLLAQAVVLTLEGAADCWNLRQTALQRRAGRPKQLDPRWRLIVETTAFTGLRAGELVGLKAQDFDADAMTLDVVRSIPTNGREEATPKVLRGRATSETSARRCALPRQTSLRTCGPVTISLAGLTGTASATPTTT